jgi:hypothetical protein
MIWLGASLVALGVACLLVVREIDALVIPEHADWWALRLLLAGLGLIISGAVTALVTGIVKLFT